MTNSVTRAVRRQILPLALIFVILALLVITRSILIENQRENNVAVRAAFDFERHVVQVLSAMQDAETGQRGFLLTGEEPYLEPYKSAAVAAPKELEILRENVRDEDQRAAAVAQLDAAVRDKILEIDDTLIAYRNGDRESALAIVKSDSGKALMDRIRAVVGELRRDGAAVLQSRLEEADHLGEMLRYASIAAAIAIIALAVFGVLDMRRRMQSIAASASELETANKALTDEMATRQAAEAQIRQMQKMEAIGQLTGGIAHDFNNMLAVIMSAMNLAQRKLARGDSDIGKLIDAATDAAQRAASLTGRLLAFSRQQPLAPLVLDANKLVAGMSDLLRRTLGEAVEIETVLAGGLWRTHADASQVENAILNLAVNGRDAMPDGGRLTIETANAHLDDRYAAAHAEVPAGQYVMIAVTDTGAGMTKEVVAKAFDPFYTTKPASKGTGLGLSQVFGFVKQSGGHVKIYSEVGEGTTVKIYLPRHFGEEAALHPASVREGASSTAVVLVVEDDDRVRTGTVDALRELGYTVLHATAAEEALERLRDNPGVDLLFTDIVMPGMNGRKLADEALKLNSGLKVLFTTGFTRNAVVHNGVLDHGVNFIAKPFTIDHLAEKLREVLES